MAQNLIDNTAKTFMSLINDVSNGTWNTLVDPTFYEFKVYYHFDAPIGFLADKSNVNSATAYLLRNGEVDRASKLEKFIAELKNMQIKSQWIYRTVSGLAEAMNRPINEPLVVDGKLSFEMFECVDWRTQWFIEQYNEIVYDRHNFRSILPDNLKEFIVSVYVRDVRIVINDRNNVNAQLFGDIFESGNYTENDSSRTRSLRKVSLQSNTHKLFHFGGCSFLPSSGTLPFESISNSDIVEVVSNWDIAYKVVQESSKFLAMTGDVNIISNPKNISPEFGQKGNVFDELESTSQTTDRFSQMKKELDKVTNRVESIIDWKTQEEKFKEIYQDAKGNLGTRANNAAVSAINRITKLPNIYNFSSSDLLSLLETGNNSTQISNAQQFVDTSTKGTGFSTHLENIYTP